MAFKPSSAPLSTGAASSSSLHSVADPDYDFLTTGKPSKLSHSSNEVLTARPLVSPQPTPPSSARRDRLNTSSSSSSSKSKGQTATTASAAASNRDNEVLKYSEFLPKLVQERQRLETELKLLATQHRAIKKRRRTIQRLTKERVLKIQPSPPQQAVAGPATRSDQHSSKGSAKRQVKILAPREHGVLAMLGLSSAGLTTKDRERSNTAASTSLANSASVRKDRRSNTTTAMSATVETVPTSPHSFSTSSTPTKLSGNMAGGLARNMVSASITTSSGSRAKASHQNSPRQGLTYSSAVATTSGAEDDDGEGRRFFGTSKYRKYEMDVMKDDGFADLFSKFQASGIGRGDDDEDEENKRASMAVAAETARSNEEGDGEGALKPPAADDVGAVTAVSGEKEVMSASSEIKGESGSGSSSEEKEKGGDSDRERKDEAGSGQEEEIEVEEPAKVASKRASSLLGSFIEMKRDYQKMLTEFEEKQKDSPADANDKIAELQAILKQLRKEQAALRARVQTSQDDAQLLESFSVGVSLFDKKKEDEAKFNETRNRRKSRENAELQKGEKNGAAADDKSDDEADDEKKQKKKKKSKKKEKAGGNDEAGEGDIVDAAVKAKQANALAEYGADSATFTASLTSTMRSSATAEYGAASTSESGFTVTSNSSVTAEYGAASTNELGFTLKSNSSATAEYGEASNSGELGFTVASCSSGATAEYGAAAGGDDEEWDDKKKKDKRKKRSGRKSKNSGNGNKGADASEGGKEDEEEPASTSNSTSSTATGSETKASKKKRMAKRASVREILLKAYHEIAYEELQFDPKPLGNGAFGVVYKALWRGTAVAVKKLMVMQFTDAEVYNFKREASIMEKYSNHPNIVKFCGISTKFPHYCIVTEYMERGCVRDALAENPDLPWKTIVGMALDAAAGILHLHAEHIVHRDLALRNMLVGRDWRVRMADFGLARMMPKDTYAKTRGNIGAVRWLAPEVITKSVYSEKSDSYAFGIVMWELLTRGEEPFADMTNVMEVALGIINQDLRPTVPRETPADYAQLMADCWVKNADDRPDFVQIHRRLKAYYATLSD